MLEIENISTNGGGEIGGWLMPRAVGVIVLYVLLVVLAGIFLPAHKAIADNVICPARLKPENPINTKDYRGRDLSKEYYFNAQGTWLKVPLGQLAPWYGAPLEDFTPSMPGAAEKRKSPGLAFAFWMPTLRWPERDTLSVPSYRFCEDGRRMPEDGEYVVFADITNPWLPISTSLLRDRSPTERLENTKSYLGFILAGRRYDLDFYRNPEDAFFEYFYSNLEPELLLRCTGNSLPNPSCSGHVWWKSVQLGMFIRFSLQDLPRWRDNIEAAYKLAHRWRDNAKLTETR